MSKLTIDIVSDLVCPWCYIGRGHLGSALTRLAQSKPTWAQAVSIEWKPFQLNPGIPVHGLDRQLYLEKKFGKEGMKGYEQIAVAARQAGLEMNLDRILRQPNTLRGHVLMACAGALADALANRLFLDYFVDGKDIGQDEVLRAAGLSVGMSAEQIERAFSDQALEAGVARETASWPEQGVQGVPSFRLRTALGAPLWLGGAVGTNRLFDAIWDSLAGLEC